MALGAGSPPVGLHGPRGWSLVWEITAVAVYVQYSVPEIPHWLPALVTLGVLYAVNLIAVKVFGELEFWLRWSRS